MISPDVVLSPTPPGSLYATTQREALDQLCDATGLQWNAPPAIPSVLHNGYYVETDLLQAPLIVRKLKDIAIIATGRPRAIIFARSDKQNAAINIPREVAENPSFLQTLRQSFQPAVTTTH